MTWGPQPGERIRALAITAAAAILLFGVPLAANKSSVINSAHNLSVSGTGPVTSQQSQVCIFCHTPHNSLVAEKPLWNHQLSIQTYTLLYTSTTLNAAMQTPNQTSKQCLSCHDGTVALGQTVSTNLLIPTQGSMRAAAVLGTDLRNDHPISFNPADDGQLVASLFQSPATTGDASVKLYQDRVECTTCHDVHEPARDLVVRKFLVRSNSSGALCLACHDPARAQPNQLNGWGSGAHSTATNSTPSTSTFGSYGTVATNACTNCHLPHNSPANSSPRLIRNYEEAACSPCHSGINLTPALLNVLGEFSSKMYSHPTVLLNGLHDAGENAFPLTANRHAECPDCHNPHAASNAGGTTTPPGVQAPLLGASGVDAATGISPQRPATNQYEICSKCHANSSNKPQATSGYSVYGRTARRVTDFTVADPYNTRLEFNSSVGRHPVTQPRYRPSAEIPSLRSFMLNLNGSAGRSLGAGTQLYCTDCHNNNAARVSLGSGPNGPHGSDWTHLLERRYEQEVPPATPGDIAAGVVYVPGITGTYALCYKCHDIDNSILQNRSFKEHDKHVRGKDVSCSSCHDPHGVQGGSLVNNYSSVNIDRALAGPSSSGILRFERTGTFSGRCYLRCHDKDHNPETY